ncbi:MAG: hypothetical protein IKI58_09770 [Oscillospiraceae bacterium]|nr:hypothetical protein [Oscillospiraceae bacterium]
MKSRFFALAAAVVLCAGMTGCGENGSGSKGSTPSGTYTSINATAFSFGELRSTLNEGGLNKMLSQIKTADYAETIEFKSQKFTITPLHQAQGYRSYSGSFSVDDGEIHLKYSSALVYTKAKGEYTVKASNNEDDPVAYKLYDLGKSGGYYSNILPPVEGIRNSIDFKAYPVSYFNVNEGGKMKLRCFDELLCTDTYGYQLKDSYRYGKSFTVTFDPVKTMETCPYYFLSGTEKSQIEEQIEHRANFFRNAYKSDNTKTTIKFSNGKWEWKNSEGELINKGTYQESSKYKGLIALTTTSDSLAGRDVSYSSVMPLMFYLTGKDIYYPCFIKVK